MADRELTTAAVRAAVRDGGFGPSVVGRARRDLYRRLADRADPLVTADLRRPPEPRPPAGPLTAVAPDRPGTLPVLDAVALGSGEVLVACGQAGVRLLAPDGRTRARWDVPADLLVPADHGGSVLLAARHGGVHEISRLDLVTRRVRPWSVLRVQRIAGSYDGRMLIARDDDGLAVLDTLADRPTVVHRELGGNDPSTGGRQVGRIARTPGGCAVLVVHGGAAGDFAEAWRWDLPGWELRARQRVAPPEVPEVPGAPGEPGEPVASGTNLLAGGTLLSCTWQPKEGRTEVRRRGERSAPGFTVEHPGRPRTVTDGDHWALGFAGPDGTLVVHAGEGAVAGPTVVARFPGAGDDEAGVRRHGDGVTYWHRSGRVLAARADGSALLAALRVTAD